MKRDETIHLADIGVWTGLGSALLGLQPKTFKTYCGKRRAWEYVAANGEKMKNAAGVHNLCLSCLREVMQRGTGTVIWPEQLNKALRGETQ